MRMGGVGYADAAYENSTKPVQVVDPIAAIKTFRIRSKGRPDGRREPGANSLALAAGFLKC